MSDYNPFSKTFSKSRQNMHWPEIDYILSHPDFQSPDLKILDVGCGSWRFLSYLKKRSIPFSYTGIDASSGMIEEAKKEHSEADFRVLDMKDINTVIPAGKVNREAREGPLGEAGIWSNSSRDPRVKPEDDNARKFDRIVFLASFHHLETKEQRRDALLKTKEILSQGGIIAITNWNLLGKTLFPKYESVYRGNGDFDIKIWAHSRYYHGFTVEELEKLFLDTGFNILENRVFENDKNIISILKK